MADAMFTPGPWRAIPSGVNIYATRHDEHEFICCLAHNVKERTNPHLQANAHLIAAAPDMYAFLIALRDNDVPEQEKLEELIAKAEGR